MDPSEQINDLRTKFQYALEHNESTDAIMANLDSLLKNKITEVMNALSSDEDDSLEFDQSSSEEEKVDYVASFIEKLKISNITNDLSDDELMTELQKIEDEIFK